MCGLVGFSTVSPDPAGPLDLKRATRLLGHRGPDEEGYYQDESCGLGIRRLSVIDLKTGHQPMANEGGTVWVVFNGEIYNYRELRADLERKGHFFRTQSDTEILVHGYEEWEEGLPLKLRGMFAFALYDRRDVHGDSDRAGSGRLLLARDPFGIKPLYYARKNNLLVFSSEMKSILSCPGISREIDLEALDQYLSFLYIAEPRTIFRSIRALPPAHLLTLREGRIAVRPYWEFRPQPWFYRCRQEAVEDIRRVFEDSVRAMLVADVPLGLFLSGGLDSASILAMMARHGNGPVRTFSIGFGARERNWDEQEPARRLAGHFQTEHRDFQLEPEVIDHLPQVIRHFDQPFANPTALILYLLAGATRRFVKVALAGTGGDELFGGYPRYLGMLLYDQYRHLPEFGRKGLAALYRWFARDAQDGRLGPQRTRRFLEGGALPFKGCYLQFLGAIDERRKRDLYTPFLRSALDGREAGEFISPFLDSPDLPELERLMPADVGTYLPYNQLAYADRMSMAQSLEVRVPFVDQRLVEVAGRIPLTWKIQGGRTKALFREAMAPFLPQEIIQAPKRGLNLPISLWLREDLREWMLGLLSPDRLKRREYFDPAKIESLVSEHLGGKRDYSLFLWALLVLEIWHQIYIDP